MSECGTKRMLIFKHAVLKSKGFITFDLPPIGSRDVIMQEAYEFVVKLYYIHISFDEHNNLFMQFLSKN